MQSLHLLLVEECPEDARLLLRDLRRTGTYQFHAQCVSDRDQFSEALDRRGWDVILSDLRLPEFDAASALHILRDRSIDLPFIVHSGIPCNNAARTELETLGACDFVLKGDAERLIPTIEREMRETSLRREQATKELLMRASLSTLERRVAEQTMQMRTMNERLLQELRQREILETKLVEVSESERRRIGYDIHDGLCQKLAGVSLLLNSLSSQIPQTSPAGALAREISEHLNSAVEDARNVARGVAPVETGGEGLRGALMELADGLTQSKRVNCQFLCHAPLQVDDLHVAGHLYRIAQEAANNGIRHGKATEVDITYTCDGGERQLLIADNGSGFMPPSPSHQGMGVNIMHYRAAKIGASLEIRRRRQGGTEVACLW